MNTKEFQFASEKNWELYVGGGVQDNIQSNAQ